MLEAIFEEISTETGPWVLAGDFNAPQEEGPHGLITWAQTRRANGSWGIVRSRGLRWDTAERQLFTRNMRDAYRELHGPTGEGYSWVLRQKERRVHRRFDHILLSRHWNLQSWEYQFDALSQNLSDHAPLIAELHLP